MRLTIQRNGIDPLLLSLRVLAQMAKGAPPSRRNIIILKRFAATQDDLPVEELCAVVIKLELDRGRIVSRVAPHDEEQKRLLQLERQTRYLARQRDHKTITDREYLELLNVVRHRHGLCPIAATGEHLHG